MLAFAISTYNSADNVYKYLLFFSAASAVVSLPEEKEWEKVGTI